MLVKFSILQLQHRGPFQKSNLRALLTCFTIDCCLQFANKRVSPTGLSHAHTWFATTSFVLVSEICENKREEIISRSTFGEMGPLHLNNPHTSLYCHSGPEIRLKSILSCKMQECFPAVASAEVRENCFQICICLPSS